MSDERRVCLHCGVTRAESDQDGLLCCLCVDRPHKNYLVCSSVTDDGDRSPDSTIEKCNGCGCAIWKALRDDVVSPKDCIPICVCCARKISQTLPSVFIAPPGCEK